MPVLQSTYSAQQAAAFPGMLANMEPKTIISRTYDNGDATALDFGVAVLQGASANTCKKVGTYSYAATGAALGTNTGNGTITASPTVGAGVQTGRYVVTIIEPATNLGNFAVEGPDGNMIGHGVVGTPFTGGGLTFTVADGSTDFAAGDQFSIDVVLSNFGDFLGATVKDNSVVPATVADQFQRYDQVPILRRGVVWVIADENVAVGGRVSIETATGRFGTTGDNDRVLIPATQARWDTAASAAGLAQLRLML